MDTSKHNGLVAYIEILQKRTKLSEFWLAILLFTLATYSLELLLFYQHNALDVADYISTYVFGITGSMAVMRSRPNAGTHIMLLGGLCTAITGGTIRTTIGLSMPAWIEAPLFLTLGLLGAISALLLENRHIVAGDTSDNIIAYFDFCAVGVFIIVGVDAMMAYESMANISPTMLVALAIFAGTVTAAGGGLIRDILIVNRMPIALTTTYGLAALLGSCFYLGVSNIDVIPTALVQTSTILVTSVFAYHTRNLRLLNDKE